MMFLLKLLNYWFEGLLDDLGGSHMVLERHVGGVVYFRDRSRLRLPGDTGYVAPFRDYLLRGRVLEVGMYTLSVRTEGNPDGLDGFELEFNFGGLIRDPRTRRLSSLYNDKWNLPPDVYLGIQQEAA